MWIEQTAPVAAVAADVWKVVADPSRFGDWLGLHRGWEGEPPALFAKGDMVPGTGSFMGTTNRVDWSVDEYDEERWLAMSGTAMGNARIGFAITIDSAAGGTTVTLAYELDSPMIKGPVKMLVRKNAQPEIEQSLARLEAAVLGGELDVDAVAEPRATWQPHPRPEWATVLNRLGEGLGTPAVMVSLDADEMIAAAVAATGLEDFGDDAWLHPYRLLVSEMNTTAELTLVGRMLARSEVIRSLMSRLRIAEEFRMHPEIDAQVVRAPVFITGMGRSGTSILLELMGEDPAFRPVLSWEWLYPAPAPEPATRATDVRARHTAADYDVWDLLSPDFSSMHDLDPEIPNECHTGTLHEFTSPVWGAPHVTPGYDMWLATEGTPQLYAFHHRLLKLLQFRTPGRFLLKGPGHFGTLPELFAEYPDAKVVITHRDPLKVMPSMFSLLATLRWQRSDVLDVDDVARYVSTGYQFLLDQLVEQRSTGALPEDQIVDVHYDDLMTDPIGALTETYAKLGIELTDDATTRMQAYLAAKPKDRHGSHRYDFADLGLDREEALAGFAPYVEYFGVRSEAPQPPAAAVVSVEAAWADFHQRMQRVGEEIAGEAYPADPRMRAEGFRYLARLQEFALPWYLEFADPVHPAFFRFGDDVLTWGSTNPDNNYLRAKVEPSGTYRISGNVGGLPEMLVSLHDGEMVFGRTAVLAERSLAELEVAPDGSFELYLGGPERPGNWLPLTADADLVLIRQYVCDWNHDPVAELVIARVDEAGATPPAPPTPERIAKALDSAAAWVEQSAPFWNQYAKMVEDFVPVNIVMPVSRPAGAAENMLIGVCNFDLGPDDALVFEVDRPDGTYFSAGVASLTWMEPAEFAHHTAHLNDKQLVVDADGKIRIVLAHSDPGVPNWLDTTGYRRGLFGYRFINTTVTPEPTGKVVKLADVRGHLPDDVPAFSAAQRRAQIADRRAGVSRRFRR